MTARYSRAIGLVTVLAVLGGLLALLPMAPARAADSWSAPQDLSASGANRRDPQIAASADGSRLTSVWALNDGTDHRIQVSISSDAGATWSAPKNLSEAGHSANWPQLSSSADGTRLTVVWMQDADIPGTTHIQSASSADSGASWSPPQDLTGGGDLPLIPQVAGSADGTSLAAVWMHIDPMSGGARIEAASSGDGGASWTAPVYLSGDEPDSHAYEPQVVASADGTRFTAVWDGWDGSNFVAQSATTVNGGASWGSPVRMSPTGVEGEFVHAAASSDGGKLTAVWRQGPGGPGTIYAANSTDGGASWSAPAALSGDEASEPDITGSVNGRNLVATWVRNDGSDDIAQVATSTDGGGSWSAPVNLSAPGADAHDPSVTSADDGSVATAIWHLGGNSDAVVQASTSLNAGAAWGSTVQLSTGGVGQYPEAAAAGNGSVVAAVWDRYDDPNRRVQASHLYLPIVQVSPASQDFGTVRVGDSSSSRPVTISNAGRGPLRVSDLALTGNDGGELRITDQSCTAAAVPAGGACTANVIFGPTSTGGRAATMTVLSDAPGTAPEVSLTGYGARALTTLSIQARGKSRKLKPGMPTKVVRDAQTDGTLRKVAANCYYEGKKLRGEDKRANCLVEVRKNRKRATRADVRVTPLCSVGLEVKVRIVAKARDAKRTTWKRTWKVKNKPRTVCALGGNG